jgi:hypothetical protein
MSDGPTDDPFDMTRYEVRLGPRAVWVARRLKELTPYKTLRNIVKETWVVYNDFLMRYERHEVLYVSHKSKRPVPVPLMRLEALMRFPPEADRAESATFMLPMSSEDRAIYDRLIVRAQVDSIAAFTGNALFFYYGLLIQHLQGDVFYLRMPGIDGLPQIDLFSRTEITKE